MARHDADILADQNRCVDYFRPMSSREKVTEESTMRCPRTATDRACTNWHGTLRQQKKGLMHVLLTGRRRVSAAVETMADKTVADLDKVEPPA